MTGQEMSLSLVGEGREMLLWIRNMGISLQKCTLWVYPQFFSKTELLIGSTSFSLQGETRTMKVHQGIVALDCLLKNLLFCSSGKRKNIDSRALVLLIPGTLDQSTDNSFSASKKNDTFSI